MKKIKKLEQPIVLFPFDHPPQVIKITGISCFFPYVNANGYREN